MEKLIEILEDLNPEVDYYTCTNIIDGHYLDSLAILSLVAEIEEEFDVVEIIPSNFNSAQSLWALIEKIKEED